MHRNLLVGAVALMTVTWATRCADAETTAHRERVAKGDQVLDANGVVLENEYLRAAIAVDTYAGQVMSLLYKPTGHELAPARHPQGYCTDRMGEDRYFWKTKSEGFAGQITVKGGPTAEARVTYTWHYNYNDVQTDVRVSKTFVLPAGSATLLVTWELTNLGKATAQMSPWVKHVGGGDGTLLRGPRRLLFAGGPADPGSEFVQPATDWVARLSGEQTTEKLPMVLSIMDYRAIFQQFCWGGDGGERFTLETILARIQLHPGKTWRITYALAATANLGNVSYAAPELAASVEPKGDLAAGKPVKADVHIAAAMDLGERRIEGEVLNFDGELVAKLPNLQATMLPGRIATLSYEFTPPANGVYMFSLTVFDDSQKIIRLGQTVNSQRSSITLPVVVGPKPEVVVRTWETGEFTWPRRKARDVAPWRTVLNSPRLKAAQVLVPERLFPEDRIAFGSETQPAFARLARGEYEDIQLAVELAEGDDVLDLELSVSPPKHDSGATIDHAELREVFYLTTDVPSGYKSFPVGQWPDPLFPTDWHRTLGDVGAAAINRTVKRDTHRRVFWLILKAPRQAPAGLYQGAVAVALDGQPLGTIPIEVRVSDFVLPQRASYRCSTNMVGFHVKKWVNSLKALGASEERLEQLASDKPVIDRFRELVLEYGWTPTMMFGPKQWEQYHDYGRGISVFATGKSKAAEEWLKSKGLLKYSFVYAPFDEHPDVEVPDVAEWCRKWKADSAVPILDCFYGSNVEPLFGLVDVWLGQSPRGSHWGEPTGPLGWGRKAVERKKQGDQFFAVNSSLIWHVEFVPVTGRAEFWNDFQVGYDGRYVYSTCRWTEDVFKKNWTSGNYMGSATYPSPDGIATSIRMETLRDGVEDYDYLTLLRERVAAAEKAGRGSEALTQAKAILADAKLADKVQTVESLHAMRDRIADLIEQLR